MKQLKSMIVCIALAFSGLTNAANAGALIIDSSGGLPELQGATGVKVDGKLYNVEFLDGICADLFDGCDDAADFTFTTSTDALAAAEALLEQVFIDGISPNLFDTDPELTRGCGSATRCQAFTPFAIDAFALAFGSADNWAPPTADEFFLAAVAGAGGSSFDTTPNPGFTWARFSEVPAPGSLTLLGAGLLALGWARRGMKPSLIPSL